MLREILKWESKMWDCISDGNGEHCPSYNHCHVRKRGDWCAEDNKKQVSQLLDNKNFRLEKYQSLIENMGPSCYVFRNDLFCRVKRLAEEYLKKGKVSCPPVPTELIYLADEKNAIEIRRVPLKSHSGALWRLSDGWIIHVNNKDPLFRQRFTLFHEAFHILAHCRASLTPVFRKRGTKGGSFNELLADCFALHALVPSAWVKEEWIKTNNLDKTAKVFAVPKPAIWMKLRFMDLI